MKVVTMYRAAKIAGVTKQAIFDLKKRNADGKSNYSFFCFDPKTGKHGINTDDIEWKMYLDRGNKKHRQGKKAVKGTSEGNVDTEQNNIVNENNLLIAVKMAIKETFSISGKEMNKLLKLIEKKYEELEN